MSKKFNITGACFSDDHFMADVSDKLKLIRKMIAEGDYFIINRPRQYGKTTTLNTLSDALTLSGDYLVLNMSFEGLGDGVFQNEKIFSARFVRLMTTYSKVYAPEMTNWLHQQIASVKDLDDLSLMISKFVEKSEKKVVILIDEVDKSTNNQLFISFLAMLRDKYLKRKLFKTFHSVVLAGVHDVKTLQLKLRPEDEKKYNSPWNIAADFTVDMNLDPNEIKPMLDDYVKERGVKMDTTSIAERLFYYTSGYPFLVSKLCKILDERGVLTRIKEEWATEDVDAAAVQLISETSANFDNLIKELENDAQLYRTVYEVAVEGEKRGFNHHNPTTNLGVLYGIFVNRNGLIAIHNRIYREVIVDYMTDKMHQEQLALGADFGSGYKNPDKSLNMETVLLKFQAFMRTQYSKRDKDFLERNGRLVFLAFLKPIINGSGYDFKESEASEERRLDVIITYLQHRYVAELKIWRGKAAHQEGLLQLSDYLDRLTLDTGYLVIFDHQEVKEWRSEWVEVGEKRVFAVWV